MMCLLKHPHPSKTEANECNWHFARQSNGEIVSIKWQYQIPLHINGKLWKHWNVDFAITEKDGTVSFWESKGWNRSDDVFRLKLSAALLEYPHKKFYVNKRLVTWTPNGRIVLKMKKKNSLRKSWK